MDTEEVIAAVASDTAGLRAELDAAKAELAEAKKASQSSPQDGEGAPLVEHATVETNGSDYFVLIYADGCSARFYCSKERATELARVLTAARMPAQKGGE